MIITLVLFFIIVAVSFILAYFSMKDYVEIPSKKVNSLFLIQNPAELTEDILNLINHLTKGGQIISLERLFKGGQSALVIFGPVNSLKKLVSLKLLELEDYTQTQDQISAWEVTIPKDKESQNIFNDLPALLQDEQFWWQVCLQGKGTNFKAQIRAVLVTLNPSRNKELTPKLQNLGQGSFIKLPKPLTTQQIYEQYKSRQLAPFSTELNLESGDVLKILGKS